MVTSRRITVLALSCVALLGSTPEVAAQTAARPALWATDWLSYNPLHGTAIPQRTRVWVGYDSRYLYFAFQCDDPEPSRIKTSLTVS